MLSITYFDLLLNVYATDGHHIIMISAKINGTNEKKYSFTTLLNVGSVISPNKKLSENISSILTATKAITHT